MSAQLLAQRWADDGSQTDGWLLVKHQNNWPNVHLGNANFSAVVVQYECFNIVERRLHLFAERMSLHLSEKYLLIHIVRVTFVHN